ncbi:MAG: protein kinase [Acidobacteriota bacterium]|jgi:serine/threonine-protein kinase
MPEIGQTISHYRIIEKLGQGGMGEVFLAHDTSLDRKVALKFLPDIFSVDPERLARLEREAKLLASLNHPKIAAIYGMEHADGKRFLAMEFVQGDTLAQRIADGPLPVDESLQLCRQIAEGLEAAHEKWIIHRDLKPANVKVTPEGDVKILDFGLARALHDQPATVEMSHSPTITAEMTRAGVILGTAAYMSPEQARGGAVDKRADIWAFGIILFELLTGRSCFSGDTVTDLLAAVVKSQPDWAALPPDTPVPVRQLLQRCLAKDRKQRLRDIADARLEIEAAQTSASVLEPSPTPQATLAAGFWTRKSALVLAGATLVIGMAVAGTIMWRLQATLTTPGVGVVRSLLGVAPAEELNAGGYSWTTAPTAIPGGSRTALAWTPDGRTLVFVGRRGGVQQLYVRALNSEEARPLPGTEGAQIPVVSPDGQWLAFWADGAIRKVPVQGGAVDILVDGMKSQPIGMSWSASGLLIGPQIEGLIERTGIRSVSLVTSGNPPKPATEVQLDETAHILPQWLPGNNAFLYTARRRAYSWSGDRVFAQTVDNGARKELLKDAVDARYVSGYLVFLRRGNLMAVPFDVDRLEVRGDAITLVEHVIQALADTAPANVTGAGQFSVSSTGTLAYVTGQQAGWPDARIVTVNRHGDVLPLATPVKSYGMNVRVDPGGRRIADSVYALTEREIWVYDIERGSLITKLGGGNEVSGNRSWTVDGKRLTFGWIRPDGIREVVWQAADDSASPEKLADTGEPGSWTPDRKELIGVKEYDIWILASIGGAAGPRPIVKSPTRECWPALSPDGHWLAYGSDRSGRYEVLVQPYPGPGPIETVSPGGGDNPVWHPNGKELFFLSPADSEGWRDMMAVAVRADAARPFGPPERLFRFKDTDLRFYSNPFPGYDVAPDGRFFVTQAVPSPRLPPVTQIHLVLNWLEEVKARVQSGK